MTSAVDPKPMSRTAAVLYAIGLPLCLVALVFVPAGRIDWVPAGSSSPHFSQPSAFLHCCWRV